MTDFFTMQPGETAAPLPPGPVLCTGTAGMRRIHRFFLWAYDEAPGLVRSVGAGDTARARYLGDARVDGVARQQAVQMKYLLDANIWRDLILGRSGAAEAGELLRRIPAGRWQRPTLRFARLAFTSRSATQPCSCVFSTS